jgi:hypothetical protein
MQPRLLAYGSFTKLNLLATESIFSELEGRTVREFFPDQRLVIWELVVWSSEER